MLAFGQDFSFMSSSLRSSEVLLPSVAKRVLILRTLNSSRQAARFRLLRSLQRFASQSSHPPHFVRREGFCKIGQSFALLCITRMFHPRVLPPRLRATSCSHPRRPNTVSANQFKSFGFVLVCGRRKKPFGQPSA